MTTNLVVVFVGLLAQGAALAVDVAPPADQIASAVLAAPKERRSDATVLGYNAKGEVQTRIDPQGKVKDLIDGFDTGSLAQGWADRRLFDGAPDWFAVMEHTKMFTKDGDPLSNTILRDDAIGRILKQPKGAVMKSKPQSTSKLGFGVKAKQSHAHFSKG